MAGKLNPPLVKSLKEPGRYSDGNNLFLSISANGGKRWTYLYTWQGKKREMGLGSAAPGGVTLAEARGKAIEARQLLNGGIDPLADKEAKVKAAVAVKTFGQFADEYIATHRSKFRNAKHIAQWEMTVGDTYCKSIRSLPITSIDTAAVLKVLQPVWQKVPETASRLRGRIENILDAAKALKQFEGENPARWKGHLATLLPKRQRLTRGHHAAMPYEELPGFFAELRARNCLAALALELNILCITRSGETLGALWTEVDLSKGVWIIPAQRMKAGREHRVPLSTRALEILEFLHQHRLPDQEHVFPGKTIGRPLSGMAMAKLLRRMGHADVTVHGFRSTFSDWTSEQTSFSGETREHALAHRISDKAEAAYRRGDQFEKRRKLMEAWASYCEQPAGGNVVNIKSAS